MTAESTIPAVEINTPTGTVTLLDAKIVKISPSAIKGNIASGASKGWIEIYSWSFEATQSGPGGHVGGGSGAGKVNVQGIKVTKSKPEEIAFTFEGLLFGNRHRRHLIRVI